MAADNARAQLLGQVAIVTGGAGGLGSVAARWLGVAGAHVVVADRDIDGAMATVADLRRTGLSAEGIHLDVTDSTAVDDAVHRISEQHGRIDVLLTSHGFPHDGRLVEMTDDQWSDVLEVCLTGTFTCVRAVGRVMVRHDYGRIITVASRAWLGNPGQANYSAAKAGVVGLTRAAAKELGKHSVTVNCLAPGLIETRSVRNLDDYHAIAERAIRSNSIKRIGEPDDVAASVAFLASPHSAFITGEVIHVSGGRFG